jgi:hypothetical protein
MAIPKNSPINCEIKPNKVAVPIVTSKVFAMSIRNTLKKTVTVTVRNMPTSNVAKTRRSLVFAIMRILAHR